MKENYRKLVKLISNTHFDIPVQKYFNNLMNESLFFRCTVLQRKYLRAIPYY